MKLCSQCQFQNPDPAISCLRCNQQLPLSPEQHADLQNQLSRLVNPLTAKEEEELRNSWLRAVSQRFDWLWEIGDSIARFQFKVTSIIIGFLIILVFLLLSFMLNSIFS